MQGPFYSTFKKTRPTLNSVGLSSEQSHIYVNESLTFKNKGLLLEAKQKLKTQFKYIWTKKRRLCIRENDGTQVIYVNTKEDLEKIEGNRQEQN